MKIITQDDWDAIPADYKGQWTRETWEFRNRDFPQADIGKRTMLEYDPAHGTVLLTEGRHFAICGDSFTDIAKPGDEVSEAIYENMLNCVPPIYLKGGCGYSAGFQLGEPDGHQEDSAGRWRPVFMTFVNSGKKYYYKGLNFAGEVQDEAEVTAQ